MLNIGKMMAQAQKMRTEMEETLKDIREEGSAGAGSIKVTLDAHGHCHRVELDDDFSSSSKDVMQDLIAAAINDASEKVQRIKKEKMGDLTSGLPIPDSLKGML